MRSATRVWKFLLICSLVSKCPHQAINMNLRRKYVKDAQINWHYLPTGEEPSLFPPGVNRVSLLEKVYWASQEEGRTPGIASSHSMHAPANGHGWGVVFESSGVILKSERADGPLLVWALNSEFLATHYDTMMSHLQDRGP